MSLGTAAQAYILSRLHLPPGCSLLISEPTRTGRWDTVLHPLVASRLGSLSFSYFKFHPRYLELVEEGIKDRCHLTLNVIRTAPIDGLLDLSYFDLSHMRTLDIDNTQDPSLRLHWDALAQSVSSVQTLIFRRRSSLEVFPTDSLPQLRDLCLVDINLDLIAHADSLLELRANRLLSLIQARDSAHSTEFVPLQRLILHNCRCKAENLAALADALEVIVE